MPRIFGAADIGSNTAHLLVAATDGELVMRIDNYNEWIPLGEVVSRKGEVPKDLVNDLVMAVKEFRRICNDKGAQDVYVFATEGLRIARNYEAVIKKIASEAKITVDIISPRREAELSLRGVMLDTKNIGANLVFEVGGGSAQIGSIHENRLDEEVSLPLGTGRLIAESGISSPCSRISLRAAETYIEKVLERCPIKTETDVAVVSGGVARGLWRALHPDGEKILSIEELEYMVWSTSGLSIDRIISRFNVKAKRAGTLLPGALVYRSLMKKFGLEKVVVSEFGIREGAILEMAAGRMGKCLA